MALELKEKTPFDYTYVFYITNDDLLYLPTPQAYEEGGYEISVAVFDKPAYNIVLNETFKIAELLKNNL
jgi:hypothetical protein